VAPGGFLRVTPDELRKIGSLEVDGEAWDSGFFALLDLWEASLIPHEDDAPRRPNECGICRALDALERL
jgi:hypothetical protein